MPETGTPGTVRGIFFVPYEQADLGRGLGVTGNNPHFVAMSEDMPTVSAAAASGTGTTLERREVTYRVKVKRPDEPGGFTVLELKRI